MKRSIFILILGVLISCKSAENSSKSESSVSTVNDVTEDFEAKSREIIDNKLIEDKGASISKLITTYSTNLAYKDYYNTLYEAYHSSVKNDKYNSSCIENTSYHSEYRMWCLYYGFSDLLCGGHYQSALAYLDKYFPLLENEMDEWFMSNFIAAKKFIVDIDSIKNLQISNFRKDFEIALKYRDICNTSFYESELRQNYEIYEQKLEQYLSNYPNNEFVDDVEWKIAELYGIDWEEGGPEYWKSLLRIYENFVEKHPNSNYVDDARKAIKRVKEYIVLNE